MDKSNRIGGITTLNKKLFVYYLGNSDITVYDTDTYNILERLQVPLLGSVSDMTSCKTHQCVYIADPAKNEIHRVVNIDTVTSWSIDDEPRGLSVNSVCNVLVTCYYVGKVKEFTTDGKLIRAINLESSIVHPLHTVELTTGQLVVCHGFGNDAVHRVCIVNSSGRVLQAYIGSSSGQLNAPVRLAVNDANDFIFVAEPYRVLMLTPTLKLINCDVASGLYRHERIWFENETRRLYIGLGENKWGQVNVYSL